MLDRERPHVRTPLGDVELLLTCDGRSTADGSPAPRVDGPARTWTWPDLAGLRAELLVVRFRPVVPRPDSSADAWGAVWTLAALQDTGGFDVAAALPGVPGDASTGERLEAREYRSPRWVVAIGGPDDDALGERVAAGELPASWCSRLRPGKWDTRFGAVARGHDVLAWRLPGLLRGESAVLHVAVAWTPNGGRDENTTWPWFAVDTTHGDLIRTAMG